MAEYIIQDTTLTNLADKVRALRSTNDTLTFDEMSSNLETERTNLTNSFTALENKGVTVPDGANSDVLADLITSISSGTKIETGTMTFTEDISSYTFVDGDTPPDIFILYLADTTQPVYSDVDGVWALIQILAANQQFVYGHNSGVRKYYTPFSTNIINSSVMGTWSNGTISRSVLVANRPYNWIAIYGVN